MLDDPITATTEGFNFVLSQFLLGSHSLVDDRET